MTNPLLMKHVTNAIYCLCEPGSPAIRYIGKTVSLYGRSRRHLSLCVTDGAKQRHLRNWKAKLKRQGLLPDIYVLELTETADELDEAERRQIARAKAAGCDLVNATDGGDGGKGRVYTDEDREKMRVVNRAKWDDPEYRRRCAAGQRHARALRLGITVDQLDDHDRQQVEAAEHEKLERRRLKEAARQQREEAAAAARAVKQLPTYCVTHGDRAFIPLTQEKFAIVSKEDMERVARQRWQAQWKDNGVGRDYWRAVRNVSGEKGRRELLNRFVMSAGPGERVRHVDGNQLNCTRGNLVLVKNS